MKEQFIKSILRIGLYAIATFAVLLVIVAGLMIFAPKFFLSVIWYFVAAAILIAAIYAIIAIIHTVRICLPASKQNQNSDSDI